MSATVPFLHQSSAPLRAIHRLRLITSHFSSSPTPTTSSSIPKSATSSRQFSTSISRRNDQFSFTTACSFRGKPGSPVYTPPSSATASGAASTATAEDEKEQPRGRGGSTKLKQGLDSNHPLSKWRDAQLEKSPNGAGHDWFFIEGIPDKSSEGSGRDMSENATEGDKIRVGGIKGVVLGVADGVGGWEESGVDPSHFAQALMWFARERVKNGQIEPSQGGKGLKKLLEGAFEDVTKEKAILAGSSTACLVALDSSTGKLHAANLGDSSYLILRPTSTPQQQPTPPPSPATESPSPATPASPSPSYAILHSEASQTHFFNAPYQLSKLPPSSRSQNNSLMDTPSDASVTAKEGIQLKEGDVVVLSTDGFGDNVFGEEMQQLCQLVHEKCLETQSHQQQQGESNEGMNKEVVKVDDHLFASSLAQTCLNFARLVMFKRDKVTPFEVEARRYGYGKGSGLGGGKVDDVTVVVAVVGKTGGK